MALPRHNWTPAKADRPTTGMSTPIAEEFDFIKKRAQEIRDEEDKAFQERLKKMEEIFIP